MLMKTPALCLAAALSLVLVHCSAQAAKPYPLDVCPVSKEKLGSMGEPVVLVQDGQEVKFCCKHCIEDFKKAPDKYLKEIAAKAKK